MMEACPAEDLSLQDGIFVTLPRRYLVEGTLGFPSEEGGKKVGLLLGLSSHSSII